MWSYLTGSCYTAMAWMAGTSVQCQKIFFHWHENYELMINVIDQQPLILSTLKTLLDNGIFPKWSTQLSLNSANLTNHRSLSLTFVFVAMWRDIGLLHKKLQVRIMTSDFLSPDSINLVNLFRENLNKL